MKKYISLLLFACLFNSCFKDEERGQYAIDKVPPGEIKSAQVENVPGGAIISYVIPDDEDLLYVKAIYTLDNGTIMEQKASAYASSLKIEGIGKSREVSVTLIAGDRSKNESKPVVVKAHPMDSPIYDVLQSIKSFDDFGGIRLAWENPKNADIVIAVITPNDAGEYVIAQNFYSNSEFGQGNLRGYPSEEREFGFYIRDRWGNLTDTIKNTFKPLFEEEVTGKFIRWNPTGIPYLVYGSYNIENLWDNNIATFYLQTGITKPHSFTFDMGWNVKFSRIKIWQRQGATLVYATQAARNFQIWGSATPFVTDDFSGWTKIGDFESYKPSGSPLGTVTTDDLNYAIAGQDFNVDPSAPPVRYLRFVIQETWSKDAAVAFGEMKFFGSIQ